ncbi:hypothetical protein BGZ61DRAFT_460013 [Ilyonectria robusta]|uniref:uncharacterized protein n=1 Tax=Ilyonectria robusta TaxID=1079257 RepID=UPI001E8DEA4F|nr:uncharacterized protein BGZ61DRAFT_460013 [Ilyonectria robusta]KAH8669829.1 hypothetical protein BGZ61DRAFT_460013 [Ilyonectria robusta]
MGYGLRIHVLPTLTYKHTHPITTTPHACATEAQQHHPGTPGSTSEETQTHTKYSPPLSPALRHPHPFPPEIKCRGWVTCSSMVRHPTATVVTVARGGGACVSSQSFALL